MTHLFADTRVMAPPRMTMFKPRIVLSVLLILPFVSPLLAQQWTNVGVGIDYRQVIVPMADGTSNYLFVARMAVTNTNAIINSMIAQNHVSGAFERVSAQASRYEDAMNYWGQSWGQRNDVVVAVNGSFYNTSTGVISGGDIYDGWYSKRFDDFAGQMGFVWKMDRSYFIGVCPHYKASEQTVSIGGVGQQFNGINVARAANQLILYTPQYNNNTLTDNTGVEVLVQMPRPLVILSPPNNVTGVVAQVFLNQGATKIPFDYIVLSGVGTAATYLQNNAQVGRQVLISQNLLLYDGPSGSLCNNLDSRNCVKAYGLAQGNFNFLKNGVIQPTTDAGMIARNPRTFVAYNTSNVFFSVCDGRSTKSAGMTSDEMGAFCLTNLLATDAVNMDGGGSSTMWLNGVVRNTPSDGSERAVANGLMMVNLKPKLVSTSFAAGQSVRTSVSSNFRLGPGTDNYSFMTLGSGSLGTVVSHELNGVFSRSNYWWQCAFGGTNGWIAESVLAAPTNAPYITLQPSNRTVVAGSPASFTVTAVGANPLRFQWQKDLTDLSDGGHYSGSTNTMLIITGADTNDAAGYRCVVTNAYGSSNSLAVTLTVVYPPAVPIANAATGVTTNSFFANWSTASGATSYRLDVSTNAAFSSFVSGYNNLDVGNVLSRSVSGLRPATIHYYRVRAYNIAGTSGNSDTIGVTTLAIIIAPPAPVANLATNVTSASFTANWSSVAEAAGYRLDVSTNPVFASFVSGYQDLDVGYATSQSVTGLNGGMLYFYRVRAYNASAASDNSGLIAVMTVVSPPAANAATDVTDTGFTANWSSVNGATGYRLDVSTNNGFSDFVSGYQDLDAGNVTNRSVTGLNAHADYHYRVRAYNIVGPSDNSATISVTTSTPLPMLGCLRQDSQLVFFWPTNFGGFALEYATQLPPTNWTPTVPAPAIVGGQYFVTNTMGDAARYYRLNKP